MSDRIWGLYVDYLGGFYEDSELHSIYSSRENAVKGAELWAIRTQEKYEKWDEYTDENGYVHFAGFYDQRIISRRWDGNNYYLQIQHEDKTESYTYDENLYCIIEDVTDKFKIDEYLKQTYERNNS